MTATTRMLAARMLAGAALLATAACAPGTAPATTARSPHASAATSAAPAASPGSAPTTTGTPASRPRPDHVVVVVFENKAAATIVGNPHASYLNGLLRQAAVFTDARAVTHPSQPNYLALFSGSTHRVRDDHCPVRLSGQPSLGRQLLDAGHSFAGYSEDLPRAGYAGCAHAGYAAKHNPWVDFDNLGAEANLPYSAFPADYRRLPTVAFVVPNLCHDMHDCGVATGDRWAATHLDGYLRWARDHNSLLVVTFDEDDNSPGNHILTLFAGAGIRPGRYGEPVDHYRVLATLEHLYGLPPLGRAARTTPITDVWRTP